MKLEILISNIIETDLQLKNQAVSAVNQSLTIRNWLIGYYIFEFEQKGLERAKYGEKFLQKLALEINRDGLSYRNLKIFRQFYIAYPQIGQTLSAQFISVLNSNIETPIIQIGQTKSAQSFPIMQSASAESSNPEILKKISFSHFVELMKIKELQKRNFYELECIIGTWNVRELKRQIDSLYYERSGLSKDKKKLQIETNSKIKNLNFSSVLKDYYVFEFLDLPQIEFVSENKLESELLNHIQKLILELGNGFCFESRQKRILIGDEYYYIDLVFYHRILKCHILIELKVEDFNHNNAGQLNTYINYYNKEIKNKSDNQAIGILLVTNQNVALVEYATAGMDDNLFVRNYMVNLPSKEELQSYMENELNQILNK
jgi:predicted nuclease of restriction endonuclease-like (RecB) superfamily